MCVIQANNVDVMCFHFEPHLFPGDDKKCFLLLMLLQAIITISSFFVFVGSCWFVVFDGYGNRRLSPVSDISFRLSGLAS
jgi:hypothetical protein